MVTANANGHRIAALDHCLAAEPVQVINTHVSRRRIVVGVWPASDLRLLPTARMVTVQTPAGVVMKAIVRMWVDGDYVYASARPCDQANGEDLMLSGAFPLECEIAAERIALESL